MTNMPKGCDQQGRYPEAAEASTEIGADNINEYKTGPWEIVIGVAIVSFVAGIFFLIGYYS